MNPRQGGIPLQRLNEEFYSAEPAAYFRDRLALLWLRARREAGLVELLQDELKWEELTLTPPSMSAPSDPAEDERITTSFVVTESQVLLHHAGEALIRMFLAHAAEPECPWLEIAKQRGGSWFRERCDELAASTWSEAREHQAAWVFLGARPSDLGADALTEPAESAVRLLRMVARRLNADSQMYNSVKHGMSVIPTEGSLSFTSDDDGTTFGGAPGTMIVYLSRAWETGTWSHKSQWLNVRQAIMLTELTIGHLKALWAIARASYLGTPTDGVQLATRGVLDAVVYKFPTPNGTSSFSMSIATD